MQNPERLNELEELAAILYPYTDPNSDVYDDNWEDDFREMRADYPGLSETRRRGMRNAVAFILGIPPETPLEQLEQYAGDIYRRVWGVWRDRSWNDRGDNRRIRQKKIRTRNRKSIKRRFQITPIFINYYFLAYLLNNKKS